MHYAGVKTKDLGCLELRLESVINSIIALFFLRVKEAARARILYQTDIPPLGVRHPGDMHANFFRNNASVSAGSGHFEPAPQHAGGDAANAVARVNAKLDELDRVLQDGTFAEIFYASFVDFFSLNKASECYFHHFVLKQ